MPSSLGSTGPQKAALLRRTWVRIGLAALALAILWVYYAGRVLVLARSIEEPDAIVSLASHEWERLPAAAQAAARYPDAIVILTLPTEITVHNCHDCARRVDRLVAAGVPASRVRILPLTAEGTLGEAEVCRRFAQEFPITRLLVVTSPYHTRRALAVFRRAFSGTSIEIGVEPASQFSEARPALWWAAPFDRWYVAYEWAALVYYAFHHDIWPALDASDLPNGRV
jgi:uncharacterized SAM-binding protein YcdF (DUF218 family)